MMHTIDCRLHLPLRDKEAHFCEQVSHFASRLWALTEDEKERLALFKAVELSNALVQIRELENAPNRLGPEKAAESFRMVRAVIRKRQLTMPGISPISLQDPALKAIIDEGCRLFHTGKKDTDQWEKILALSTAQYIVLNSYLKRGLSRVYECFENLYPDNLRVEVIERFITPYETSFDKAA